MTNEESVGDGDAKTVSTGNTAQDSIVLEEEIDPNYVPTESEIVEYAKWLGMDLDKDKDLFWVAKEGLMAPLPKNWKPCKTKQTEDIYYFNFSTGESTWDHPCDGYYKRLFEEAKKKKETAMKESSDSNRTQAKADVEKLMGKVEKKKKKRTTDIDSLASSMAKKSAGGGGSASNSLSKAPLAPIGGGGMKLEKKALPGISSSLVEPKRSSSPPRTIVADNLRKSEVSLLTSSFDSSSAGSGLDKNSPRESSVLPGPSIGMTSDKASKSTDSTIFSSSGTKRSKMSSRLAAVVSDSGENQIPTPSKEGIKIGVISPAREREALAAGSASTGALSNAAEAKEDNNNATARSHGAAGDKQVKDSTTTTATVNDRDRDSNTNAASASLDKSPIRQQKQAAEAKSSSLSSSSLLPLSTRDSLEISDMRSRSDAEIAKLTGDLRKAEEALSKKNRQCDRLTDELAEIERSLSREKQNQSMAEQTESALLRQARDAKDQLAGIQARSESLQKENDEYRIKMKELTAAKGNEEAADAADEESTKKTIAGLKEQVEIQEATIKRNEDLQKSMREELSNQSTFYDAKVRSAMKASADATEDLTRLQSKLEKALTESEKSSANVKAQTTKIISDAQNEVVELKKQRSEEQASAEIAKREMEAASESLKVQLASAQLENKASKARESDMDGTVKRLEQLVKSWEADCSDRDKRLSAARARSLELEEEKQKAMLESRKLEARLQAESLNSGEKHSSAQAEAAKLLKDKHDLEDKLNEQREESASLRRRLNEALTATPVAAAAPLYTTTASASDNLETAKELAAAKKKVAELESTVSKVTCERDELTQRVDLLDVQLNLSRTEVEANKVMLVKLQSTRESAMDGFKDEVTKNMSTLEAELSEALKVSASSTSQRDFLQIKVDSLTREIDSQATNYKKLTDEMHRMNKEMMVKDSQVREMEMSVRDTKLNDDMRERAIKSSELEAASLRSTIARQQDEIERLSNALASSRLNQSSSMVPPPVVVQTTAAPTIPPQAAAASASASSMMDMGILMGQQQANAAVLQNRLKEADELISKIHSTMDSTSPRSSSINPNDNANTAVNEVRNPSRVTMEKATKILDTLDAESEGDGDNSLNNSQVLREMLIEFVRNRDPMTPSRSGKSGKMHLDHWSELLSKEIMFVTQARRALRDEKVAIKWEQQLLLSRREIWKNQKHSRSTGSMQILNQQTSQLNEAVERVRKTTVWINSREDKLQKLQALLRQAKTGDSSVRTQLEVLTKELDLDTLNIGLVHPFAASSLSAQHVAQFRSDDVDVDAMPQHLAGDGVRTAPSSTYFPQEMRAESNTYIDAQENKRPQASRTNSRSLSEFSQPARKPVASNYTGMNMVAQARADGESAYGAHANWLDSIRGQIDGFSHHKVLDDNARTTGTVDIGAGGVYEL
jgi:chromosome segregation ATPase